MANGDDEKKTQSPFTTLGNLVGSAAKTAIASGGNPPPGDLVKTLSDAGGLTKATDKGATPAPSAPEPSLGQKVTTGAAVGATLPNVPVKNVGEAVKIEPLPQKRED